jgi:hypothetical protein
VPVKACGSTPEWAFAPNWSIKAEYMFIGLSGHDLTSCGTAMLASGGRRGGGPFCFNHDFPDIHTAKVGINRRFGSCSARSRTHRALSARGRYSLSRLLVSGMRLHREAVHRIRMGLCRAL